MAIYAIDTRDFSLSSLISLIIADSTLRGRLVAKNKFASVRSLSLQKIEKDESDDDFLITDNYDLSVKAFDGSVVVQIDDFDLDENYIRIPEMQDDNNRGLKEVLSDAFKKLSRDSIFDRGGVSGDLLGIIADTVKSAMSSAGSTHGVADDVVIYGFVEPHTTRRPTISVVVVTNCDQYDFCYLDINLLTDLQRDVIANTILDGKCVFRFSEEFQENIRDMVTL